jgi:hypothetical protein
LTLNRAHAQNQTPVNPDRQQGKETMKLLKKISIGTVNGIRGGLRDIKGRVMVMVVAGICGSYKEKVSETMGTSYAFAGEFRAVNRDGEECAAPVAFLPEPAQSLLKSQIDDLAANGGGNVEFGFRFYALEDETAIKGYAFEVEPLMEARPSTALAELTSRIGVSLPTDKLALGHDEPVAVPTPSDSEPAAPAANKRKR